MARVAVVTDTTADMPPGAVERLGIRVVPLMLHWDGVTYRDKVDLSIHEFYHRLRHSKTLPKTSAPSIGTFEEIYRAALDEGAEAVVSIHISAKLSATCDIARQAAENIGGGRVQVVDSRWVSLCLGFLAMAAAELARQGADAPAVVAYVRQLIPRCRLYAMLDTLEFLQRGGRIGRVQALAGTLLSIRPIIQIRDGEVMPLERVRTTPAALKRIAELVAGLPPIERLGVLHGDAEEYAAQLRALIAERLPNATFEVAEIGSVIGTHAGPRAAGACVLLKGS